MKLFRYQNIILDLDEIEGVLPYYEKEVDKNVRRKSELDGVTILFKSGNNQYLENVDITDFTNKIWIKMGNELDKS